jgi:hypothetical protein
MSPKWWLYKSPQMGQQTKACVYHLPTVFDGLLVWHNFRRHRRLYASWGKLPRIRSILCRLSLDSVNSELSNLTHPPALFHPHKSYYKLIITHKSLNPKSYKWLTRGEVKPPPGKWNMSFWKLNCEKMLPLICTNSNGQVYYIHFIQSMLLKYW